MAAGDTEVIYVQQEMSEDITVFETKVNVIVAGIMAANKTITANTCCNLQGKCTTTLTIREN